MNKTKFRSIALAALLMGFAAVLSFAIGSLAVFKRADAASEYRPAEIFSAGTGGNVSASEGEGDNYVRLTLNNEGSVHFRRDLALKWFESDPDAQSDRANPARLRYFSLTFSFPALSFTRFSLVFEGAEENISKDNKSTNSLVFFRESGSDVTAAVRNASAQPDDDETEEENEWNPAEKIPVEVGGEVTVSFDETNCDIGEFAVYVNETYIGNFTNIGGYFLEYFSSASSTPRVPMTFRADSLESGASEQQILVINLNGQSLRLTDDGKIVDDTAPVLVLNEKVYSYILGKKWSLSYEAIDVCASSVSSLRRYAMLKAPENGAYTKPELPELGSSEGNEDYHSLTTSTSFMPTSDNAEVEQYVSIFFDLEDKRTDGEDKSVYERVYLTWYAVDDAVATLGEGEEAFDYIRVNRNTARPSYVGVTAEAESKTNTVNEEALRLAEEYQAAVDEASEGLSVGSGAYFYLPSLRGLIASDNADYRNLRFSVYYKKQSHEVGSSASSATSLRYNNLRFEIDEEGKYVFKVLASDASGNAMQYYTDDKLVDVTANNIWDIEEIPSFTFSASYSGATIEDPGEQALGYSYSTYSVHSFDIVALAGYQTKYKLYRLDPDKLPANAVLPDYSNFAKDPARYFKQYAESFVQIKEYNDQIPESDKTRWERTDNKYHWDPDNSLSFIPQEATFYVVELTVTEAKMPGNSPVQYQVIDVRTAIDGNKLSTFWLENNIWSVVLFSISAVLLVIVVILFVVKPSDKSVEEIDLKTLKGDKKNKSKK